MFSHVYPAWHKPAQKVLFFIAAVLCISLPAIYGSSRKPKKISAVTMGTVFGVYFGLWAIFSLVARFLVPSPTIESALPSYDPSPIPEPVNLYTPSRPGAVPTSPAIRLNSPTLSNSATITTVTAPVKKGPKFADDIDGIETIPNTPIERQTNNVRFQARPSAYTRDSDDNSVTAFPTFADYRQSQHGNFEAFAQRIKKTFASSQQQQQQQQQQREQQRQQEQKGNNLVGLISLDIEQNGTNNIESATSLSDRKNNNGDDINGGGNTNTRRQSTSSVSIFLDLADRIRSGSLFSRSQNNLTKISLTTDTPSESRLNNSSNNDSTSNNLQYSQTVDATYIPAMEAVITDPAQSQQ
ncbi:hypothetical protein BGZ46_005213 [Entomortierella lignicola]|nr:hypothetical protein BGZ46_005213 [Entomortierella lignicola]